MELTKKLQQTLQDIFGFSDFRPGQLESLQTLMDKGRLLCIQPTGYGKSLLYQLPAVLLDGITLVISPLLALMRDQISQLNNRFKIAAVSINTDQSLEENHIAKQALSSRKARLLFISPEQLDHPEKFDFFLSLPIRLLVVDEAHCISTWGHDFRPSYRQIIKLVHGLVEHVPDIKLLGLTATANRKTEDDIKKQLSIHKKTIIVHRESMQRTNIRLTTLSVNGIAEKLATLLPLLSMLEGSGLIYCATRENTEIVAEFLQEHDVKAAAYHAGFDTVKKSQLQQDFLLDRFKAMAATNALGMGIDKSNLRFIIHFDIPGSITAYYQEVGRAGRDGLPAEGILFYDTADQKIQRHFIYSSEVTLKDFTNVISVITAEITPPNLTTVRRLTGMHATKLSVVLAELVEQGFVKKQMSGRSPVYVSTSKKGQPNLSRYDNQLLVRNSELKAMLKYGEATHNCLMQLLCQALGDVRTASCGQCSVCNETPFVTTTDKDFMVTISSWLNRKTVSINLKKLKNVMAGIAVLNGKFRSTDFVSFMKERATSNVGQLGITDSLFDLMKTCLLDLAVHHPLGCIIALPSRTWGARDAVVKKLGNYLKLPVFEELLEWKTIPSARQGSLLNNDQRDYNVQQHMHVFNSKKIPKGALLLVDDYIGSGATMKEAVRALREDGLEQTIVPFTIAAVQWRVGHAGMI